MTKDWEARFQLAEPHRISRRAMWMLFPFASVPFLVAIWGVSAWMFGYWALAVIAGFHLTAILMALRFHRVALLRYCAKFFGIGAAVGIGSSLLALVLPGGWGALFFLVSPGLIFMVSDVPYRGWTDYAVLLGIAAWGTAICYALFGAVLFARRPGT